MISMDFNEFLKLILQAAQHRHTTPFDGLPQYWKQGAPMPLATCDQEVWASRKTAPAITGQGKKQ